VAAIIIMATAAAIVAGIASSKRSARPRGAARPVPVCIPAQTASPQALPRRLGAWKFTPIERGTFPSVVAGLHGAVLAVQACGAEETSLRVLELRPGAGRSAPPTVATSEQYPKAAPVASSVFETAGTIWFGEGRLALHGGIAEAPYRLSLHELDPTSLRERRSIFLGRGYGIALLPAPAGEGGSVVVSTGQALDLVTSAGSVRSLASFPGLVVQHAAAIPGSRAAVVSVFTPSAAPPAPSTRLELVDLESGRTLSELPLSGAEEVESLAAGRSEVFAVVGNGGSTVVERLSLYPSLSRTPRATGVPETLTPLSLATTTPTRGVVYGATTLACVDLRNGAVLASTSPDGPAEAVAGVAQSASDRSAARTVAIVPAGIGTVELPDNCR
jgi:hypothetical protein